MRNLEKIKTLINSNADYQNKLREAKESVKVWKSTGLLEGLKTDHEVFNMALLMTNQAKELIKEATETGTSMGSEEWSGIALPLVRKVFGEISAKEFVSVQSLSLPSSLVFYLDFKYSDSKPGYKNENSSNWNKNSVYGILNTEAGDTDVPKGGFYGFGKYTYSENLKSVVVENDDLDVFTADSFKTFLNGNPHISADDFAKYYSLSIPVANLASADLNAIRSFAVTADGETILLNHPEFTQISGNNVLFLIDKAAWAAAHSAGKTFKAYYTVQPNAYNRGDFEDKESSAINIPEIDMDLKSIPVVVKTRKLKAKWTPEMAQDLISYHVVDAELELTNILSSHIGLEIDLEVIDMLIQKADSIEYWSANPSYEWNKAARKFESNTQYYINNKADWYQTFGIKMQKVSNMIHQKTMRGGANFVVCSPTVATVLESLNSKWSTDIDGTNMKFNMGVQKIGTFANQLKVYKNPYMTEDTVLMGYKGSDFLETGAVFAPYIPLMITPLLYDPETFTPRKGVMTRYAKVCVRPEFYAKIYIGDTHTI